MGPDLIGHGPSFRTTALGCSLHSRSSKPHRILILAPVMLESGCFTTFSAKSKADVEVVYTSNDCMRGNGQALLGRVSGCSGSLLAMTGIRS